MVKTQKDVITVRGYFVDLNSYYLMTSVNFKLNYN